MGVANGAVKELTVVFFFPRGFKLVHLYVVPSCWHLFRLFPNLAE